MRNDPAGCCDCELVPRLSDQKRGGCMVNPTKKYQSQSNPKTLAAGDERYKIFTI